jgi:hypothetical protein
VNRSIDRPGHLDAGQKSFFYDAPPQIKVAQHRKPPRLLVAG